MKKHQIRIVGGIYKRTPINIIDSDHLRPTPDRVRETLFNWLNHFWAADFSDKQVLDLFAGSGALGFEAASRGVAKVQIIDNSAKAIAQIKATKDKLGAQNIDINKADAITFLQQTSPPKYDLVLLDPPFGLNFIAKILPLIGNVMQKHGLIYLEQELNNNLQLPDHFEVLRQAKAGNVQYSLIKYAALQNSCNSD